METTRKYIEGALRWMAGRRNDLGILIFKVTGEVKRVLEKVKSRPVQETKPVIVQSSLQTSKRQHDDLSKSTHHTKNPDRIFHIGLVGLGICFIGLIIAGVIYLIIVWVMR
jgi:hypothetical protein